MYLALFFTYLGCPPITENTFVWVAVDWLLSRKEPVGASSQEEIGRGLGVPAPEAVRFKDRAGACGPWSTHRWRRMGV